LTKFLFRSQADSSLQWPCSTDHTHSLCWHDCTKSIHGYTEENFNRIQSCRHWWDVTN